MDREAVARLIAFEGRCRHDVSRDADHFWENSCKAQRETAYRQADAILSAMPGAVEPSDEAVEAGARAALLRLDPNNDWKYIGPKEQEAWRVQIRTALRSAYAIDRPAPVVDREALALPSVDDVMLVTNYLHAVDTKAGQEIGRICRAAVCRLQQWAAIESERSHKGSET